MIYKRFIKNFFLFFFLILLVFSCKQVSPEMRGVSTCVVFDYSDYQTLPQARLSIYVDSNSDVRRVDSIEINSLTTDLKWIIENEEIQLFNDSKKQWAGNSNLYMPYKNQFPNGQYELIFKNADEKFQKSKVNLKYDSAFYEKLADEIPSFMESKKGKKQIAIFDKENKMIYFGEQDEELKNNRAIWLKYKDAAFYKEIWTLSDNSVMCILPKKDVVPE
jgi:hypothetical protein